MEMITFLKRRFSSGDLQGEAADKREQEGLPGFLRFGSTTSTNIDTNQINQYRPMPQQVHAHPQSFQQTQEPAGAINQGAAYSGANGPTSDQSTSSIRRGRGTFPSAPTSPTRSYSTSGGTSFMNPMGSITGQISSTIMRGFSSAASTAQQMASGKSGPYKERQKILLVIDDSQTDWGKYFRGRKVLCDWEIRVEQAQFSEISMTAYSDQGCVVNIFQGPNRTKPVRSFKPDFVLLREHLTNSNEDWQPILVGLMYSGTPCVNTLHAVYNMKNRPWLFAHLLMLRNRLGKEAFPLISQTYYTCNKEMITAPIFPTIVKVGHGHGGEGKIRADDLHQYQDITSLLTVGSSYATTEPFVDAKCDLHIQKIRTQYKSFVRKSISGHWKSNMGSSIIEKVPTIDKFKQWVDEVARMFGGLDICSVEALQNKSGEYFIYDVNGSDMVLFGETQEEDRREISEIVVQRMQNLWQNSSLTKTSSLQSVTRPTEADIKQHTGFATPQPSGNLKQVSITRGPTTPMDDQPYSAQSMPPQQMYSQPNQTKMSQQPLIPVQPKQPYIQPQNTQPLLTQTQTTRSPIFPAHFQSGTQLQYNKSQTMNQTTVRQPSPSSNVTGSWDDQSTHSSISSSGGSASSAFTGIASTRVDGNLASGQSTPIGSTYESKGQNQPSPFGSSPYQTNRPCTFNSAGMESSTAGSWENQYDSKVSPKPSEFRQVGQRNSPFDSNDPFDTWNTGGKYTQDSAAHSTSSGQMTDKNWGISSAQSASNQERPFVPPRQTSLRTGSGGGEETDDTMKNLRKTFAGIFGDM